MWFEKIDINIENFTQDCLPEKQASVRSKYIDFELDLSESLWETNILTCTMFVKDNPEEMLTKILALASLKYLLNIIHLG